MAEATCRENSTWRFPRTKSPKQWSASPRNLRASPRSWVSPRQSAGFLDSAPLRRRHQGEVVQSLVPERVEKAVTEQKTHSRFPSPQVDKLDFAEGQPLKFRAVFEVLPEFDLGITKISISKCRSWTLPNDDVNKALKEMTERAAAFAPVEGRAVENGDFVQLKLVGTPDGGGEPLRADSVLCHIGAEETMEPFNEKFARREYRRTQEFRRRVSR